MPTTPPLPAAHAAADGGAPHVPALDGLRGLAILLVIPHNVALVEDATGFARLPAAIARAGWVGVELFFVLSGFLITQVLLAARADPHYFRNFYARRVLRIVPLYYLVLLLFLYLVPHLQRHPAPGPDFLSTELWFWLFLNNWAQAAGHMIYWFGPAWSLAVEEQFYLLWPLIVARADPARLLRICGLLIVLAFLGRCVLLFVAHAYSGSVYRMTICRMDSLAAGAAVALLVARPGVLGRARAHAAPLLGAAFATLAVGAAVSGGYSLDSRVTDTVGYTSISLAVAAVLLVVLAEPAGWPSAVARALAWRPLRSAGRYSYAMYLFHFPLALLIGERVRAGLEPLGQAAAPAFALIVIALSWALGAASYYGFERHFLRLKRYFVPAAAGARAVGGTEAR